MFSQLIKTTQYFFNSLTQMLNFDEFKNTVMTDINQHNIPIPCQM